MRSTGGQVFVNELHRHRPFPHRRGHALGGAEPTYPRRRCRDGWSRAGTVTVGDVSTARLTQSASLYKALDLSRQDGHDTPGKT